MKNMNPVVKLLVMFVVGCVLILAVEWLSAMIKGRTFEINWFYIILGGALIAVLDKIFPAEQRKKNRENLKNSFKK